MRVLVVVGVRLYREGLARSLARRAAFDAVLAASPTDDLLGAVAVFQPSLVLVDMQETDHLDLIRGLIERWPDLKIVAVGVEDRAADILPCASAGVRGLVSPEASLDELVEVISSTVRGEFCWSARATGIMARHIAAASPARPQRPHDFHLTARETEVACCLGDGQSNKQIARDLGIEVATVKNHIHHVLEKLGVKHRNEAVAQLHNSGWFMENHEPSGAHRSGD